jgi:hypothetical protein
MPTHHYSRRESHFQYFYKHFERFAFAKNIRSLKVLVFTQLLIISHRRKLGMLEESSRRRKMILIATFLRRISFLNQEMNRPRVTVFYPSQQMQTFDDETFETMFRFKRAHFYEVLDAMKISGELIKCGRKGKYSLYPADLCLMVVLRRLSYPCRFVDLVNIFGLPSNRIIEIFHSTVDFLFVRFAQKLNQFSIWTQHFPHFAQAMEAFGAPFNNLICIILVLF